MYDTTIMQNRRNQTLSDFGAIDEIRASSRQLVRSWGILQANVAGTNLSASAAHAIIEIGKREQVTASDLTSILLLKKSTVSRMLAKLVRDEEIDELPSKSDARLKLLALTNKGRRTLSKINEFSRDQVARAFFHMSSSEQKTVSEGLALYARALSMTANSIHREDAPCAVHSQTSPSGREAGRAGTPSIIEATDAAQLDAVRQLFKEYADTLPFKLDFQDFDAELRGLPGKYACPAGCLLLAYSEGKLAGCVGLWKLEPNVCEMKRMFVRPQFQGLGIGKALAQAVVNRAKSLGYKKMRLDTVPFLIAAISLYRKMGFVEIEKYNDNPIKDAVFMELDLARTEE